MLTDLGTLVPSTESANVFSIVVVEISSNNCFKLLYIFFFLHWNIFSPLSFLFSSRSYLSEIPLLPIPKLDVTNLQLCFLRVLKYLQKSTNFCSITKLLCSLDCFATIAFKRQITMLFQKDLFSLYS